MPEVLIITVNYRAAESTAGFLKSAALLDDFAQAQILVVENGSHDGSDERLRPLVRKFGNVEMMESAENRGYFGAANWALQTYLARGHSPNWVIVCNNDILFDDRQFLCKLSLRDPRGVQVIAPGIVARLTGVDCNPYLRKRPTPFQVWRYRFWVSNYYLMWFKKWLSPKVRILRHHLYSWRTRITQPRCSLIYAPHGSFLVFGRSYFEAGGYIDDSFFLYAEEFSIAEICRSLNLRVVHDPELKVWHDAHRVTGRMCNRTNFEQGKDGLYYILRKYFFVSHAADSRQLHQ